MLAFFFICKTTGFCENQELLVEQKCDPSGFLITLLIKGITIVYNSPTALESLIRNNKTY